MLPGFTSVISAAVVSGDLIIGLSDGSQINCGRVQGPQGLKGDSGPIGAPGTTGVPGNTIHTVRGAPEGWLGRDGDFAINTALWEIYGPRAGGVWGSPTPLRGNRRNGAPNSVDLFGSNSAAPSTPGPGGGTMQTTRTLPLANPTLKITKNLPDPSGLTTQEGFNHYVYDALESLSNGVTPDIDLSEYATIQYVDQADTHLQFLINNVQSTASDALAASGANSDEIADIKLDLENENYATTNYVDEECEKKLNLTGGKLKGALSIEGGCAVKTSSGGTENIFQVVAFSSLEASKAEYYGPITTSKSLATKEYADTKAAKSDLATATTALPYRLETDKTMLAANLPAKVSAHPDPVPANAGGEIQLVDNLGYFHNVTFDGEHGITTNSTPAGIVISAPYLSNKIEQLESAIETLISLIPPVDIGNVTITSSHDTENGAYLGQNEMGIFTANNDGDTQHGLRYSWKIIRGSGRISGPTNAKTCTMSPQDPPPGSTVLQCIVTHPATEEPSEAECIVVISE